MTIAARSEGIHMTCPWRTFPFWDIYIFVFEHDKSRVSGPGFPGVRVSLARVVLKLTSCSLIWTRRRRSHVSAPFWVHNLQTAILNG